MEIYFQGQDVQIFAIVYTGEFMIISAVLLGYSFWFMNKNCWAAVITQIIIAMMNET